METEIELKFFVSPDFSETLRNKIAETKVLQHSCRELGNIYFDTPDNWLRKHDTGLRIRRFDCLLYTSPSPRDSFRSRMPSSA